MYHRVFETVVLLLLNLSCSTPIGIDDKLDFGHTGSHPSFRRYDTGRRNSYELPARNVVTKVETIDNFDQLGIVCVDGGCNTTKSINDSGNTVKTDVLVHIETKVDLNHNKTEPVRETPDVPVVVGYRGAKLDITNNDDPGLKPRPVFIPSLNPLPAHQPKHASSGAAFNRQFSAPIDGQLFQSGYFQNEAAFNIHPSMTIHGQVYSPNDHGQVYSPNDHGQVYSPNDHGHVYSPNDQSYYPASKPIIDPPITLSNRRIDSGSYGSYGYPLQENGMLSVDPQVNINIKTFPSVAVGVAHNAQSNMVDTQLLPNVIELTVPYFEPSHHSHHFGEHTPPQFIHSNKKPNRFNPVEFKTTKSPWTPSVWYNQVLPQRHTGTGSSLGEDVKCVCHNRQVQSDLQWYPNMNRRVSSGVPGIAFMDKHGDPGSQINDKLAPLN